MSVNIRKYQSLEGFQADALRMAEAGWNVAAQSTGSKISEAGSWCAAAGIVLVLLGVVASAVLLVIGVVLLVIGAVSRSQTYTVTYQYAGQTKTPGT